MKVSITEDIGKTQNDTKRRQRLRGSDIWKKEIITDKSSCNCFVVTVCLFCQIGGLSLAIKTWIRSNSFSDLKSPKTYSGETKRNRR